jgi:hypothetical protein
LLTATVAPPVTAVARHDVSLRLADYKSALYNYLEIVPEQFDGVVFVDNSGSDLETLTELIPVRCPLTFEFISFFGNDHPVGYGKAYGEFRLVEYALARACLITPFTMVWKSTGRLVCSNLASLAQGVPSGTRWVGDLHNVPGIHTIERGASGSMDLRVFGFTPEGYRKVIGESRLAKHAQFNAAHVYLCVRSVQHESGIVPRFPIQPRIRGISGRTGRDYDSLTQKIKNGVRAVCRRVLPFIWL